MPRPSGRGGGAPRGGGRPKPGTARIGGMDVPIDDDPTPTPLELETKPGELYPPYAVKPPKPLDKEEKACINLYLSFRQQIHDGPIYTIPAEATIKKAAIGSKTDTVIVSDPFENGVETYHKKYEPPKRTLPQFTSGRYELKYFPRELWRVIDPSLATEWRDEAARKKRKVVDTAMQKKKLDAIVARNEVGENVEDEEEIVADAEDVVEELVDDDFDDEEMGGDYDAEGYFDDGGDDGGDDYDGGGDGGDVD